MPEMPEQISKGYIVRAMELRYDTSAASVAERERFRDQRLVSLMRYRYLNDLSVDAIGALNGTLLNSHATRLWSFPDVGPMQELGIKEGGREDIRGSRADAIARGVANPTTNSISEVEHVRQDWLDPEGGWWSKRHRWWHRAHPRDQQWIGEQSHPDHPFGDILRKGLEEALQVSLGLGVAAVGADDLLARMDLAVPAAIAEPRDPGLPGGAANPANARLVDPDPPDELPDAQAHWDARPGVQRRTSEQVAMQALGKDPDNLRAAIHGLDVDLPVEIFWICSGAPGHFEMYVSWNTRQVTLMMYTPTVPHARVPEPTAIASADSTRFTKTAEDAAMMVVRRPHDGLGRTRRGEPVITRPYALSEGGFGPIRDENDGVRN